MLQMRFWVINFKLIVFVIFYSFIFNCNISHAIKNKILFKIDNEIITSIDLLQEAKYLLALNNELNNENQNVIFEISKKSLIKNKIKEIELNKRLKNLEIDKVTMEKLLLNYFARLNIKSEEELNNFFISRDINRNFIEKKIKIDVFWNEFIISKYSKNIKIDKEKIKLELKNKEKQYEFLLSEILFNLEKNENLNKKFQLIKNVIQEKGFSKAALNYSLSNSTENGGELGWVKETSLNKKIKQQISALEVGEYTKPIVVPGGFLILKLNKKRLNENKLNLEEAVKEVAQKKANEQFNQYSRIYFNKVKKNIIIDEY